MTKKENRRAGDAAAPNADVQCDGQPQTNHELPNSQLIKGDANRLAREQERLAALAKRAAKKRNGRAHSDLPFRVSHLSLREVNDMRRDLKVLAKPPKMDAAGQLYKLDAPRMIANAVFGWRDALRTRWPAVARRAAGAQAVGPDVTQWIAGARSRPPARGSDDAPIQSWRAWDNSPRIYEV